MKKIFIVIGVLCSFSIINAEITIKGNVKIETSHQISHPIINPEGDKILYTTDNYEGLNLLELKSGEVLNLSEGIGAGYRPVFAQDGKVYYQNCEVVNRLRNKNLVEWDCNKRIKKEILPMSRETVNMTQHQGTLKMKSATKRIGLDKDNSIVYTEDKNIVIEKNGKENKISPISDAISYLWVTLSPSGDKILFVEPHKGIFTCNLDGTNLKSYGRGDNPIWLNDDYIITTKTKDDGYVVLEARLYYINLLTGSAIALTSDDEKIADSSVSQLSGKIAYATENGELHIVEFETIK